MSGPIQLTILMPCLNEAETLARCIEKAKLGLQRSGLRGEIVIADNGSTDGSQAISKKAGVHLVPVKEKVTAARSSAGSKPRPANGSSWATPTGTVPSPSGAESGVILCGVFVQ